MEMFHKKLEVNPLLLNTDFWEYSLMFKIFKAEDNTHFLLFYNLQVQ